MMPMSSECSTTQTPTVALRVAANSLKQFTTLLQSGIFLSAVQGITIADLLTALPGFSLDYIQRRVQTIFVNGLPADSLEQQISEDNTVLAISAAMPGLAGAIFRKGGAHASLRTATATADNSSSADTQITVRLKLFNIIAKERGLDLLTEGCLLASSGVEKFLAYRPPLAAAIDDCTIDEQAADDSSLQETLATHQRILLTIQPSS